MTGEQIIFLLVALFTLGSGFMVVTTGNLVHAALWLVSTLFGVAVTYALLERNVSCSRSGGGLHWRDCHPVHLCSDAHPQGYARPGSADERNWWVGALLRCWSLSGCSSCFRAGAAYRQPQQPSRLGLIRSLSWGMPWSHLTAYVLPFEVASVLLVAALVGAVYVAFNRK